MSVKSSLAGLHAVHALVWLGLLTAVVGVVACATAGYLGLAAVMPRPWAVLIVGAVLLVTGIGTAWLSYRLYLGKTEPASPPGKEQNAGDGVEQSLRPMLGDDVTDWVRNHRGEATLAAAVLGGVVIASPALRRNLVRALGPLAIRGAVRGLRQLSDD